MKFIQHLEVVKARTVGTLKNIRKTSSNYHPVGPGGTLFGILPIYLSTYLPIYLSFFLSFYLSIFLSFYLSIYLSIFLYLYLYGGFIKWGVPVSPWLFQVTKTKTVIHDARMMPGDTPMTNSRRMAKGKDFTWYHLRTNKGVQCEHVQKWPHAKSKHDNFLTFVIHTLNLQ